ncbi:MAG TPA: hypothetical protein P5075_07600 [Eubacteriales bacterium]|nr:hypothetical protein [Eubacteriales bacterium]
MKKLRFINGFSRIGLVAFFILTIGCIVVYPVACFLDVTMSVTYPVTAMTAMAAVLIGYFARSFGLKASLNRNRLTIGDDGAVTGIDTEAKG